jgi:inosine-uridine nucleoside N-ribohydrolase
MKEKTKQAVLLLCIFLTIGCCIKAHAQHANTVNGPLKVIFETDIGNDIDDAMALDMLYKYADQKDIEILGISINKDNAYSATCIDIMNTWYGYPSIPIGIVKNGINCEGESHNYAKTVCEYKINDKSVFNGSIQEYNQIMESTRLYRKILSGQADSSVVIISVGFSTNIARLLDSPADEFSSLSGKELIAKKVKFLSMMAGNFNTTPTHEYNVVKDIPSAKKVFEQWPTPIVTSPFEVGNSILYPATSIENDFRWATSHPLIIGYKSYLLMPYDRPTWDLTAVLYAVENDKNYFTVSEPGVITVDDAGYTKFNKTPNGNHAFLLVSPEQKKRIQSRLIELITKRSKKFAEKNENSIIYKDLQGKKLDKAKKQIDEDQFVNPGVQYRPLRIIHSNLDTVLITKLKQLGYGGIVTNVSFDNYLRSENNWRNLQQNISFAIKQKGLRIWLYDEKGYPSGTAGGLVLAEHPELEAQGLAVITKDANALEEIIINHPKGHGKVVLVRAYRKHGSEFDLRDQIDLTSYVDNQGNLQWKAPVGEWIVYYFVQKPFYEGTHAAFNWVEKRRYINLLEKQATEYFIKITHQEYYKHLGKYFGEGIEAFFTDEPSLLGTYFTGYNPPGNPPVLDVPDHDFQLLPTLNWGNSILQEFESRRGYDLLPFLPYLVSGENEKAQMIRIDYYRTLSELVAESYFEPLENFCTEMGVASSGHLLFEENLYMHPLFEGNIMSMYKQMHYPGIDLLTAYPKTAKKWGVTAAKQASSVANFYNKKHVMSEISNAFDKDEAGIYGRIASVGVQFAFGIDQFNSYYVHTKMSETENHQFTDYIARVGYLLDQGKRVPKVALFYPIESVWANTLPSKTLNPQDFNQKAVALSDNFRDMATNLVENQIDFDYMDTEQVLQSTIIGNRMVTPSGGEFEVLIIPEITMLDNSVAEKIKQLAKAGVRIILQIKSSVGIAPESQHGEKYSQLKDSDIVMKIKEPNELATYIKKLIETDIRLEGMHPEIVSLAKLSPTANIYLFVNAGDSTQTFKVNFKSKGGNIRLWDPSTGNVNHIKTESRIGALRTELTLNKWQTVLITIEP